MYTTNQIIRFFILCKTDKYLVIDAGKKKKRKNISNNSTLNKILSGYCKTKAIQDRKNIAKLWLTSGFYIMNRPIAQKKDRSHNYMESKQQRKVKEQK